MPDKKPFPGGMSRRDFLRLTGTGIASATVLSACGGFGGGGGEEAGGPLIFTHGPEQSGSLQQLINQFNRDGDFQVRWRLQPADTGQYFDKLRTEFQAGGGDIDVISGDVIWPAQFGSNGWVMDLTDRFTDDMTQNFLPGPVEAVTFEDKRWAVPWFTDAGMLYYRTDLLEKAGFSEPPKTWDELTEQARKIQRDEGVRYGLVYQGANYEGGVVNGLEFIWNAGGDVLDPEDATSVIIDSPEAVEGLTTWRNTIESRIAPESVVTFKEQESDTAFRNGDSVFLRNWPYVYGLILGGEDKVKKDQVDATTLPTTTGDVGNSALGGWNLFINAQSGNEEDAWSFIEFLAGEEATKLRATKGAYLPPLESVLNDPQALEVPVINLAQDVLPNVRSRPVSPVYSDLSLAMGDAFNAALAGELPPDEAVGQLQEELTDLIERAG